MQTGYVICSKDLERILCLTGDKSSVSLVPVETTKDLNRSICLPDLTEAKNVYERFRNTGLIEGLEICNVARLYKKFY